jgi:hypothetical protein
MNKFSIRQHGTSENKKHTVSRIVIAVAFLCGCVISASLSLFVCLHFDENHAPSSAAAPVPIITEDKNPIIQQSSYSSLQGIRILVAIAAYDFSQLPHLEEVIDAYQGKKNERQGK